MVTVIFQKCQSAVLKDNIKDKAMLQYIVKTIFYFSCSVFRRAEARPASLYNPLKHCPYSRDWI